MRNLISALNETIRHVLRPAAMLAALFALMAADLAAARPASGVVVHTVLSLDGPLEPGDYVWEDRAAAPGKLQIVVDLAAERLYVYRGGAEIARTFILYGEDPKPTPTGRFTILQKKAEHYSNLYDNAPMPFMLRLTWDGVAIHGTDVDPEFATHGCVGVPEEFAQILFRHARLGDEVLITRGWMTNVYGR